VSRPVAIDFCFRGRAGRPLLTFSIAKTSPFSRGWYFQM